MDIFLYVVLIAVGIALIVKCGDWFVDSASWVAKISGIPTFVIGATIVSLGTTLPEIITSCIAAGQGSVELAIGNAVGSVNANIGLIMALSLMFIPAAIVRKDFWPKAALLILAIGSLLCVCLPGKLYLGLSFIVLAVFVAFIIENLLSAKAHKAKEIDNESYNEENDLKYSSELENEEEDEQDNEEMINNEEESENEDKEEKDEDDQFDNINLFSKKKSILLNSSSLFCLLKFFFAYSQAFFNLSLDLLSILSSNIPKLHLFIQYSANLLSKSSPPKCKSEYFDFTLYSFSA